MYFKFFCILFFILAIPLVHAQTVYQKINEIQGGFTGTLDEEDSFGVSVDRLSDLDGNGVTDIAVGALNDDDGGTDRGAVWILFMKADNTVLSETKISSTSGNFSGVLEDNDHFGNAVALLGDLNNDGLPELAVGANHDGDGGYHHGAFWILSLNVDGTVNSYQKISETEGSFDGLLNDEAFFGSDIENIGDLNSDGVQDLAVGATGQNDGGDQTGAIWILFMNQNFSVNTSQKISDTQGNFSGNLADADHFGSAIAGLDNLKVAVGAPGDDDLNTDSGSVYILFLTKNGTVDRSQKISNLEGDFGVGPSAQDAGITISEGAYFGKFIDGITDIDGDGQIEIIVGAMKQQNLFLGVATGAFFLVELSSRGSVSETTYYTYKENCFEGELQEGDLFGGSVCFLDDNNHVVKAAIGAYHDSENGIHKGAVWVMDLFDQKNYEIEIVTSPSCSKPNGVIAITGTFAEETYSVRYNYDNNTIDAVLESNSDGEIILTGLEAGLYSNISITVGSSGCSISLDNIELPSFVASYEVNSINPTYCDIADGKISISGGIQDEKYTLNYHYRNEDDSVVLTADADGNLILSGLNIGLYSVLTLTSESSGCSADLVNIELTCVENQTCFEVKQFFTPNADGKNDYWQLEMTDQKCDYTIYIYDRFGKLLQILSPKFSRWDGTYNGKNMASNDYWYKIVYSNNGEKVLRGHFTLKR